MFTITPAHVEAKQALKAFRAAAVRFNRGGTPAQYRRELHAIVAALSTEGIQNLYRHVMTAVELSEAIQEGARRRGYAQAA